VPELTSDGQKVTRPCWQLSLMLGLGLVAVGMAYAREAPVRSPWTPLQIAQSVPNSSYQPGDKIAYLKTEYPEVWAEGTFLTSTPGGVQPIIREEPNEFSKTGFERASQWSKIRPSGAGAAAVAAPLPTLDQPPVQANQYLAKEPPMRAPMTGEGLLTEDDILDFLEANLGADPWGHPRRGEVIEELAGLVKQRGVNFHYEVPSDFNTKTSKFGITDAYFEIRSNYGPPTTQSWLMGSWSLNRTGRTLDYRVGDEIWRQGEIAVDGLGKLTLDPGGSYTWAARQPNATVRGRWRQATAAEMGYQGGDGVVLIEAKDGWDWRIRQDRETLNPGNWISIQELITSGVGETGFRP